MRNLLLLTEKEEIQEITFTDIDKLDYNPIEEKDVLQVGFIKEIIIIKNNVMEVDNYTRDEHEDILTHLFTTKHLMSTVLVVVFLGLLLFSTPLCLPCIIVS